MTPVGTLDTSKPTEKPKARTEKVPTSKSVPKRLAQGPPVPQKVSVRLFETSKLLKSLGNGVSFLCDVYLCTYTIATIRSYTKKSSQIWRTPQRT